MESKLLCFVVLFFCVSHITCRTFTPVFYSISLDFSKFTQEARTFQGEANIYFNVTQNTYGIQEVLLDAELLQVYNVEVIDANTNNNITIVQSVLKGNQFSVWIKLDDTVARLQVKINYRGQVGRAGDTGVFMTDQQNIIATNSYPLGVRKIFPCVNDPSIRTSFHFDFKLVNNTWGIHRMTDAIQSPFLPAHAVGFIMTYRYRKVDDISTDRFNVWIPNNNQSLYDSINDNKILKNAFAEGTYFDRFFEAAYLDKIHIVMVPGLKQLSLVNHRLISIRPDFLIWSKTETAEMAKGSAVATINALSKHFFRCVVSPKNWNDFWLADSLALYLQYSLLNNTIFHNLDFPELFMTDLQRPAMRGSTVEVNPKVFNPDLLITADVYPPAYQGASVLKMLETLSSKNNLNEDLFNYYKNFVYENVETNQFLNFMANGSMFTQLNSYGKSLGPILDKWIHQTGYPYLTAVSINNNGFNITQGKFIGANTTIANWLIPFVYKDEFQSNGTLKWLNGQSTFFFTDPKIGSWILLNKQSKGMFRVNYGHLQDQLLVGSIYWNLTGSERAALVDDAYALAWKEVNGANLGNALSLFDKLANETDYVPFSIAMDHINTLKHLYSQKGLADNFELKIAEILDNTYSGISWYKQKDMSVGKSLWTRAVVEAACDNYASTCQSVAEKNANVKSEVLNDLLPTINCYQIRKSPQTKWKEYFTKLYNKEDTQYVRADALYALACPEKLEAKGSSAIKQYLDIINSDSILVEDALRAFSYIYSRTEHTNQTFTYIHDSFSTLLTRFGDEFVASLIKDISKLLLPPYYNDLLNVLKWQALEGSKTYSAIVSAQADMESRNQFVNTNIYQVQNWIQANSTTYKPLPPPTTTPTPNNGPGHNSSSNTSSNSFLIILSVVSFITLLIKYE